MSKIIERILCVAMVFTMIISTAVVSEAKYADHIRFSTGNPEEGIVYGRNGDMYIYKYGKKQYGWVEYRRNMYYAYETSRYGVPKGSLATSVYREHNGRIYFFCIDGKMLTHDTNYIKLEKGKFSVRYIYTPGDPTMRYSVKCRRYQRYIKGKWTNVGKNCYPHWMIDKQR